jgi:putative methanogenesis marker protein 1
MKLKQCLKGYKHGTHRAVHPAETFRRLDPKLPAAGVTRVADITGLDRIGIPVFSSIRPMAEGGAISVYNGKGTTAEEARVSAMMEAIERYSAEVGDRELLIERYSVLREHGNVLNPRELILPDYVKGVEELQIPWIEGFELRTDDPIYVPAAAVFHPLPARYDRLRLFRTNTNGLAGGNELEEAIFHGLAEVIERDAWSLVEVTRDTGPLVRINGGEIGALLEKFRAAEVSILIRDITSDIGVPTFAAVSDDLLLRDPTLLTIGMGTHTNAGVAAQRAITEVAQSRLTQIHGAREDTVTADVRRVMGYEWLLKMNKHWFEQTDAEEFEQAAAVSVDTNDFLEDIHYAAARLRAAGLERVIVVNLTREELGVPVVRVLVPGLEMYGVDNERLGRRCKEARKRHRRLPGPES